MRTLSSLVLTILITSAANAGNAAAGNDGAAILAQLEALGRPTAQVVVLQPAVTVNADWVLLADLAPLPAASRLATVVICPAPLPGLHNFVTRDQVELQLLRAGFKAGEIQVLGAASISLCRAGQSLRLDEVQAAVGKLLGFPVIIDRLPPVGDLPVGPLEYRLRSDIANPPPDCFSVSLEVLAAGQPAGRLTLMARPAAPATHLPFSTTPLSTTSASAATGATTPPPTTTNSTLAATGAAAPTATAAAGVSSTPPQPLWRVRWGDKLTLLAIAGQVRIQIMGEARGTGGLGDTIQVDVELGGQAKSLPARLLAPDRAQLEL
jgi:hypothetical protein